MTKLLRLAPLLLLAAPVHAEKMTAPQLIEMARSNPAAFRQRVANGRRVYYENCFFCHGDLMQGEGMFAHALNPIPTNFQDTGTIPQLQESFLFWRIAKGGPGMPEEGGPWLSAMPAWEQFLTEEEIWDVILFLYRPERYGLQSEDGDRVADVIIGKQRNGPTGKVQVTFIPEYASFERLAKRPEAQPF